MLDLYSVFETIESPDAFHRVDASHPLDLYIGIDEKRRWTLLLVTVFEPPEMNSSKMISVNKGQRKDGRWAVSLSLVDNTYKDLFLQLCGDIIDSSRDLQDKKKAISFVAKRYWEWRELLANSRKDILSINEAKGLLGEMVFLKEYLAPLYGIEKAALSWAGPRKAHQDYIIDDTWYEVKTIASSRTDVGISSIEQLDVNTPGELIVIRADKTSVVNRNAINLNQIYHLLLNAITNDSVKSTFSSMLFQYGYYPRAEYESADYVFEIKEIAHYSVSSDFPCLRRNCLPASVSEASYSLLLPSILPFRKD